MKLKTSSAGRLEERPDDELQLSARQLVLCNRFIKQPPTEVG